VRRAVVVSLLTSALFAAANARAEDAVSAPTASDVQPQPPEPPRRTTYSGLLSGGAALRQLFSMPLDTGVVGLGFVRRQNAKDLLPHQWKPPSACVWPLHQRHIDILCVMDLDAPVVAEVSLSLEAQEAPILGEKRLRRARSARGRSVLLADRLAEIVKMLGRDRWSVRPLSKSPRI
jgi:hypothetical protein